MSFSHLLRLNGIVLLVSAVLVVMTSIVTAVAFPTTGPIIPANEPLNPLWVPLWSINFIGTTLLLLGLPGLYFYQAQRVGLLGLLGWVMTFCGYVCILAIIFYYIVLLPFIVQNAPVTLKNTFTPTMGVFFLGGGTVQCLGLICLGIATIRAKVFARLAGVFLLVGGLLLPTTIGFNLFLTLLGLLSTLLISFGSGWIGYDLLVRSISSDQKHLTIRPIAQ